MQHLSEEQINVNSSVRGSEMPGGPTLRRSERYFRAFLWFMVGYGFVVWLITLVDWLQHPLAESPYAAFGGAAAFRPFALFVGAPLVAVLGAVILRKQRQNVVGLLMLVWSCGFAAFGLSVEISPALYALVSLPIAAWWMSFILIPFYFPDGRPYPRWLSPVLPAIVVYGLVAGIPLQMSFERVQELAGAPANPFYVAGMQAVGNFLLSVLAALMLPLIAGVLISPLLRFRQAGFVQRQQIKWFAWWSAVVFMPYLVLYMGMTAFNDNPAQAPPLLLWLLGALIGVIGLFPPIIIAFAILRYRLYAIDVIIRKTLVYALLSALLSAVYFGMVVLMQSAFDGVSYQESPITIVLSTLVIAALFAPLRRRVQTLIDRRFYVRKYDARETLAQFVVLARDEVNLEALSAAMTSVVQETMQPAHLSLWLKE